jgi:hypothetical protein
MGPEAWEGEGEQGETAATAIQQAKVEIMVIMATTASTEQLLALVVPPQLTYFRSLDYE